MNQKFRERGNSSNERSNRCPDTGVVLRIYQEFMPGGDCVSGPATVIRAIAAGKVAAANIDKYLGYNHIIESDVKIPESTFSR